MHLQETDPDWPLSVQESSAEVWAGIDLLQGQGHWLQQCLHETFWKRSPLSSFDLIIWGHGLASGQTMGREHSPSIENWIKDLLSKASPIRTRPTFSLSQSILTGSCHKPLILIHQRVDRGKPQSQKTDQTDHMDHSLANSMKLWAMPCRATQDRRVMVESSGKMWSTGEGNGKLLQYSFLENLMNNMKR